MEVHGNGANMDNFETHDERRVMPWSCFSVEPGIYLPHFGVRSEINMFVGDHEARVTGESSAKWSAVMPPQALAAVATLLALSPHGNRIELQLDRGSAELIWISPSTFHFRRVLNGPLQPVRKRPTSPSLSPPQDSAAQPPAFAGIGSLHREAGTQNRGAPARWHAVDDRSH